MHKLVVQLKINITYCIFQTTSVDIEISWAVD